MKKPTGLISTSFIVLLFAISAPSIAQKRISPSITSTASYHDVYGPIRDMDFPIAETQYEDGKDRNKTLSNRNYPFADPLPDNQDPAWQKKQGTDKATAEIVQNWLGQSSGSYPADCNGAVGPSHFVQTINVSYQIYDKSGTSVMGPYNMNTLFSGVTGDNCNDGDPIILFDEEADKWFAAEFSICGGNDRMLIAVSQTNDPTGTWDRWSFDVADTPDYMKFGVWRDGYYMATNNSGSNDVYAFERDVMIAGGAFPQMVGFTNNNRPNSGFHCIMPLDNDWIFAPPGTPGQFITINDGAWSDTDQLWVYELDADWTNISNSTFGRVQQINTSPFDADFGTSWSNIAQPGGQKLDAVPQVLMYRAQYINFGSHQTIVCCHSVDVDNTDHAGIRWYELRNTGSGWSIRQQGTYAPDSESRWMAGISMNQSMQIGLAYSISSTTMYPGIRFTGQSSGENAAATGVMDIAETVLVTGAASQSGVNRWGDYTQLSVDPADNNTFWFSTQYNKTTSVKGCQISAFRFHDTGDPVNLNATEVSSTEIDLTWFQNSDNEPVLLAWSADGNFGTPLDGTSYSQGNTIPGGGTVLYYGYLTSNNHTSLTPSTLYYYKAWSYMTSETVYSQGVTDSATTNCIAPTGQATSFSTTLINNNDMTIQWQRGNGDEVIVVAKEGSVVNSGPVLGISYVADANFGNGSELGSGNFVVYIGTGTNADITGLDAGTIYHFAVYEYFTSGPCYTLIPLTGNETTTGVGSYCTAGTDDSSYEMISKVQTPDFTNSTTNAGYADYTDTFSTDMTIGTGTTITVTLASAYNSDQVLIWVDWNYNGVFTDTSEKVYTSSTGKGPFTTTITPPPGSNIGITTMRIRLHDTTPQYNPNTTPCDNAGYGEVEDYAVNVMAALAAVANFDVDRDITCAGSPINFNDMSANDPTFWNWTFSGASLASSNVQNPVGIVYAVPGNYPVQLIAANSTGPDTLLMIDFITVTSALNTSVASSDVSVFEGSDGMIDLTINGGTAPYSVVWNNGTSTEDLSDVVAGTYLAIITDSNRCVTADTAVVNEPALSISEIGFDNIYIFPNPNSGKFQIHLHTKNSINRLEIEIVDILGQCIMKKTFADIVHPLDLDISAANSGMYFVRVISGNDAWVGKLIKK